MIDRWILATTAAAAAVAAAAQAQVAVPALPAGVYEGSYVCPQGPTGLRLTVRAPERGQQVARFDFGHEGVPRGAYLVFLQAEGEDIVLTPRRWLNRPRDYDMVGARLRRNGEQLSGTISSPNCSGIALRRIERGEARPH